MLSAWITLGSVGALVLSWYVGTHTPKSVRDFTVSDWCAFTVSVVLANAGFFSLVASLAGAFER